MSGHPVYPHPGPGPSSYYQQPPPPHQVYENQSAGQRQNYYPYPGLPPPNMNPHPTQYHHQPGPSRGNHRGNFGGSYNSRGTHHYNNYQQPHYPHPALGVHAQHSPQHMYSPRNQPYTASYPYPSPTAPVFTPSWQQQPISPLPKQLSMPPPPQPFYEPPPGPPPAPIISPAVAPTQLELTQKSETSIVEAETLSTPPQEAAPLPHTSSYSHTGTIPTTDTPATSAASRSVSPSPAVKSAAKWAIWSRRPQDPSHAPSIIISPKACPPPDVVQQAFDLETPPPSVPSSPALPIAKALPSADAHFGLARPATSSSTVELTFQSTDEVGAAAWTSQTNSSVPSSSATENADTPTVPSSPASSQTSVSISGTLMKELKKIPTQPAESDVAPTSTTTVSVAVPETQSASVSTPGNRDEPTPTDVTPQASTSDAATASSPGAVHTKEATEVTIAAPVAAATPPPQPKKLWASLLRPSPTSTPGPSRNALPTSSVVGFSIPAAASTPSGPAVPVSATKKSELVNLLTKGPSSGAVTGFAAAAAGVTSGATLNIRPRGLVNSGNMCFANSVLQVLVYCPPFHRLFLELGKVLVGPVVGSGAAAGAAGKDDGAKPSNSATPLVDATAEFLREFVEDKKKKDKTRLEVVNRNGTNGTNGGRGKGKEREVNDEAGDDDWDGDSFLPTYIYDAMKEKKRFDNMGGGHQEDAEEFFGFYLDTLEEELLAILHSISPPKPRKGPTVEEVEVAAPPEEDGWLEVGKGNKMVITRTIKATESPITRIFGGKFRATLRAPGQKDSVVVEDWRSLRLDIQREQIHTIQDALSYISHPQSVQVTQPARSGVTVDGHRQELIEALPPILVLHIKRFHYDVSVGGVVKVGKQVRFGPELEITPDIMVPAARKTQPVRYKLFGVLYHHGLSASGGHYTLDVLHPNRYPNVNPSAKPREGWVRIDDDLVSDVRPEDVFGASERDDSKCAYLLFYRRI